MPVPSDYQVRRGTALATFTQTGTYSSAVDLAGLRLVGLYSDTWPGAAGSVTFRAAWAPGGTGWPVVNEAGAPYRVTPFGSGTYYSLTPGSVPEAAQFIVLQVGTAGTAGVAAGGTIVVIGQA